MKKYLTLLMIAALMASLFACNKDDDDDNPPAEKKYTVEYKFEVNENHGDVKLTYFDNSADKKETENPTSPWQMSYTDFLQGDSVYFQFDIVPLPNTNLIYSWEVNITENGGTYFQSKNGSGNTVYNDTVAPVIGGWAFKIE